MVLNSSVEVLITAFHCTITRKSPYPIRRPIADVIGERFDAIELRLLKKAAQSAGHIRFGDAR